MLLQHALQQAAASGVPALIIAALLRFRGDAQVAEAGCCALEGILAAPR